MVGWNEHFFCNLLDRNMEAPSVSDEGGARGVPILNWTGSATMHHFKALHTAAFDSF